MNRRIILLDWMNPIFRLHLAVLVSCLMFPRTSYSQYTRIEFDRLSTEDGLSSNMIHCIMQDSDGFLWFGTPEGVNRYDGNRIIIYRSIPDDTTSLLDDYVLALMEDSKERLWVATRTGLNVLNKHTDRFTRYPFENYKPAEHATSIIGSLTEDIQGRIWYGDQNMGILRFDDSTERMISYLTKNKHIGSLHRDSGGNLWAGAIDNDLYLYNIEKDSFQVYNNQLFIKGFVPEDYIWTIIDDTPDMMLIGTSGGVFSFDPENKEFSRTDIIPNLSSSFRNNEVKVLFRENDEFLWVGTWGRGLYILNRSTGEMVNYVVEPNTPTSLSNNDINSICKDASGVIWVGTQDGINIIDPAKGMFTHYQNDPNNPNCLSLNFVTSFCEDRFGNIWIGTYGDGINIFNPKNSVFNFLRNIPGEKNSLIDNAIRAICEDPYGFIWIGTMKGLNRYNPVNGEFLLFKNEVNNPESLSGNDILSVVNGKNGDIWIGTYGAGLNRLQSLSPREGRYKITRYLNKPEDPNSLVTDFVRDIYVDDQNILWIGSLGGGLDKFDPLTNLFTNYSPDPADSLSISNRNINSIIEDHKGYLWIGTWNGMVKFDKSTGKFISYKTEDGLGDKTVSELQEDNKGIFWVSTFKGLSRFDPEGDPLFVHFNPSYGLQGFKFNINASLKARDGTLYFGGTTGFNVFNPEEIEINRYIPKVAITDLSINNRPVPIGQKLHRIVYLNKAITEADKLILYHAARIVSIEFAALSYSMKIKNQYAYKLEGYDEEWNISSAKDNVASYNNLPPGDYIFMVKAANSSGIWNDTPRELKITVMPPPWQTWWAFLIYSLIIAVLLYMARSITLTQANLKHNLKIQQLEKEKIEELNNMKLRFFTNITHEFKTPLTLIISPLQQLLSDASIARKANEQLQIVERNTKRLMYLINQLMDFRKTETGNLHLAVKEGDLIAKLNSIKEAFDEFAKEHSITFQLASNVPSRTLLFDQDKIEKIVYNLLSNAFKFTPDKGAIQIVIYDPSENDSPEVFAKKSNILHKDHFLANLNYQNINRDFIYISVIDSGIGISRDRTNKIFERFYQVKKTAPLRHALSHTGTGIGLSLTKDLVELHHGTIRVESTEGKGTCFTVSLSTCKDCYRENEFDRDNPLEERSKHDMLSLDNNPIHDTSAEIMERMEYSDMGLNLDSKNSILLVDDNPDILKFLKSNLKDEFIIFEALNGAQGLSIATDKIPDLVISDVMMPEMDGIQMCEKLKSDERTSHIPVILLTAYSSAESYISGFEKGADDYIPKPFNIKLLTIRIRNLIASRKHLHELFSKEIFVQARKVTFNSMDEKFLRKAISIVEANMDNPEFNVDTFGKEIGMSRTNLFRKFKALTNQSASEFIRTIRIKKAAQLMLEGYNVSEVTYKVGINSRSYFKKCFMEHFNVSPSEFIKQFVRNKSIEDNPTDQE